MMREQNHPTLPLEELGGTMIPVEAVANYFRAFVRQCREPMSSPPKNWLKKDMTVGSILFFMGVMMIVLSIYFIKIGVPRDQARLHQEQARLNQGIVMCENTPMNDSDVCPVEECTTITGGSGSTVYCTTKENTKEQQKDIKQQQINDSQQGLQILSYIGIPVGMLLSIAGAGIFFIILRGPKQKAPRQHRGNPVTKASSKDIFS